MKPYPLLLLFSIFCVLQVPVHSKVTSGDFQLSGVHTERVLGNFVYGEYGGKMELTLTSPGPYENESNLKVRAYRDTVWPRFQKETLCTSKVKLAELTESVSLVKKATQNQFESRVFVSIPPAERNHYWYFTIDDCSLEEYFHDNRVPTMHATASMRNYRSKYKTRLNHFGADQQSLVNGHLISWLVSGFVCLYLFVKVIWRMNTSTHTVHVAVLWVFLGVCLDCASSFLELFHLQAYLRNGYGLYVTDALAAYAEAICDASVMVLLLSIAAGWTLPNTMIAVVTTNANPLQSTIAKMSHPLSNPIARAAGLGILGWHLVLAQLGRLYNDDFDSYHDFAHLPGFLLLWTRIVIGLLFAGCIHQNYGSLSSKLRTFYVRFGVAGCLWFFSLPLLVWFCTTFMPYHRQNSAIFSGSAFLQTASLVGLSWLVTSHNSSYAHYSHMNEQKEVTLNESLTDKAPRTWSLGKKTKVRLD